MNPSLIGHFDGGVKVNKDVVHPGLDLHLGRVTQIAIVKIKKIVVFDLMVGTVTALQIPDRLEQATCDEPSVRETKLLPPRKNHRVDRVP